MAVNQTVYIKAEQNVEVQKREIRLNDIMTMECADNQILAKIKNAKLFEIPDGGKQRVVISILNIIERIHRECPYVEVRNLGVPDIIVTYEPETKKIKWVEHLKVGLVVVTSFVGSAFAIMTFNNDSGITRLFDDIFEMFMGYPRQGFSILDVTYSLGIAIGILVFFNHFGKRKFSVDPTPIEIEMRLYEKDIQTTLIEDYSRKGKELDVGQTVNTKSDRP